jgi:CRP/FNR family transcriptional regulator
MTHGADNPSSGASMLQKNDSSGAEKTPREADQWPDHGFQASRDHLAILDEVGNIVLVNRAWTRFARENGAPDPIGVAVGANYLEVCRRAAADTNDDDVKATLAGIVAVLNGAAPHFECEYPCHSPSEQRWFLMTATRLDLHGCVWAILSHRDITAEQAPRQSRHEAERANKAKSDVPETGNSEKRATKKRGAGPAIVCQVCPSRSIGLCSDFEVEELARYAHSSSRLTVSRDQALVREGEPSRHVLSVLSGALMLSRLAADGRSFVTDFIWPGESIGLFAEEKSAFSAIALTPTEVCRHSHAEFESLMANSPRLARHLFLREHSELSAAQQHAALLGCASARARLAQFLLRLQERQGRLGHRLSPRVDLPMRRPDIASHLSMTAETLSRIFQDFVRRKYIVAVPNGVRILARETLVSIGDDGPENDSPR